MSKPKLFIGSSLKNQEVAEVLKVKLKEYAEATVWNKGVFGLGYGVLETLLNMLEDFDFAVFILAPDDVTTSKDETKLAPRDNVLFESGLFMGVLGRDRVFLVYDQSAGIKIPSDLAGVALASYDGARIGGSEAKAAVSEAARLIGDRVRAPRFPFLVGEWKSEYPMTAERGSPMVTEVLSVRASGDCLYFATKDNSHGDNYTAWGRVVSGRQIIGKWKSHEAENNMDGVFMLTFTPLAKFMYGYSTAPDEKGGIVYGSWVLAKMSDADEARAEKRMEHARSMLREATIFGTAATTGADN
jgi:hypothetical protein